MISCGGCGSQPANTSPAAFRWVHFRKRVPRQNLIRSKNSAICTCATANSLNSGHLHFVAHVAQGNAQANAVNSADLAWSRLVRDPEVGGSNPLAPTTPFRPNNLRPQRWSRSAWRRPGDQCFKFICPAFLCSADQCVNFRMARDRLGSARAHTPRQCPSTTTRCQLHSWMPSKVFRRRRELKNASSC